MINSKKNIYSQIFVFFKPYLGLIFFAILMNTLFSAFNTFTIALIKPVFQIIFNTQAEEVAQSTFFLDNLKTAFFNSISNLVVSPKGAAYSLLNLSVIIIVAFILKNIFKYIAAIVTAKFEEGIVKSIRDQVFSKLMNLSIGYFTRQKQGNLISLIANETSALASASLSAFSTILREGIQVILFALLLLSVSVDLTLISSATAIVGILLLKISRKYLTRYANRMQSAMKDYTTTMQESFYGIRIIKAYSAEFHIISKFFRDTYNYLTSSIKHKKIITLVPAFNEVLAITALAFVLYFGGMQVANKQLTSDDLMLFLFSLFSIMSHITTVIHSFTQFPRGKVAADKLFEVINYEEKIKSGNLTNIEFKNAIEFRNVTFSYDKEIVLDKINFKLERGKKIAFVGSSGSGKSTILDLLIRFYDPIEGSIELDGINIKEFDLSHYRKIFGIVSQEILLFNDTIENNIRFGRTDVPFEQVQEAARMANADKFIQKLENKYQTEIGDRGVQLSGGERQRIAIARALLSNPEILIFDEATSALDNESEKIVQSAINEILKNKTAIIVAHRLSTIVDADLIFVLQNGKIVESGSHSQLIAFNGVYKKLYDLQ